MLACPFPWMRHLHGLGSNRTLCFLLIWHEKSQPPFLLPVSHVMPGDLLLLRLVLTVSAIAVVWMFLFVCLFLFLSGDRVLKSRALWKWAFESFRILGPSWGPPLFSLLCVVDSSEASFLFNCQLLWLSQCYPPLHRHRDTYMQYTYILYIYMHINTYRLKYIQAEKEL